MTEVAVPSSILSRLNRTLGTLDSLERIQGGLSRASVWRVSSRGTRYALKGVPKRDYSLDRLVGIHRYQELQGIHPFIPRLLRWSDHLSPERIVAETPDAYWELATWMPGSPILFGELNESLARRFHLALDAVHRTSMKEGIFYLIPPGIQERVDQLLHLIEDRPNLERLLRGVEPTRFSPDFASYEILDYVHKRGSQILKGILNLLVPQRCYWILRDLRREHILVHDDAISGIVDFSASRVDWPALDSIRFFSTILPGNEQKQWEASFARSLELNHSSNAAVDFDSFMYVVEASLLLSGSYWIRKVASGWEWTPESRQRLEWVLGQLRALIQWWNP